MGYAKAIHCITKSTMYSNHKKRAISNLPTRANDDFYNGICNIATSSMYSEDKAKAIINASLKRKNHI